MWANCYSKELEAPNVTSVAVSGRPRGNAFLDASSDDARSPSPLRGAVPSTGGSNKMGAEGNRKGKGKGKGKVKPKRSEPTMQQTMQPPSPMREEEFRLQRQERENGLSWDDPEDSRVATSNMPLAIPELDLGGINANREVAVDIPVGSGRTCPCGSSDESLKKPRQRGKALCRTPRLCDAIWKVRNNGLELAELSDDLRSNHEIAMFAVKNAPRALQYVNMSYAQRKQSTLSPRSPRAAEGKAPRGGFAVMREFLMVQNAFKVTEEEFEVVVQAVSRDGMALEFASERCRDNMKCVLAAITNNGLALQYASDGLRKNGHIVKKAVSQSGWALKYASYNWRSAPEYCLLAVAKDGMALEFCPEKIRDDAKIVQEAVSHNGMALQFASKALRTNAQIVFTATKRSPMALQYAILSDPEEYKDIERRVLMMEFNAIPFAHKESVAELLSAPRGWELEQLGENYINDVDLVRLAVRTIPQVIADAPRDVALQLLREDGDLLRHLHAPALYAKDREMVLQAVTSSGMALRWIRDVMQATEEDKKLAIAAVSENALAITYAPPALYNDKDVVLAAIRSGAKDGWATAKRHRRHWNRAPVVGDYVVRKDVVTSDYTSTDWELAEDELAEVTAVVHKHVYFLKLMNTEGLESGWVEHHHYCWIDASEYAHTMRDEQVYNLAEDDSSSSSSEDEGTKRQERLLVDFSEPQKNLLMKGVEFQVVGRARNTNGKIMVPIHCGHKKGYVEAKYFVWDNIEKLTRHGEPLTAYYMAPEALRNDPEVASALVARRGALLQVLSPDLRRAASVLRAAVTQSGCALRYAFPRGKERRMDPDLGRAVTRKELYESMQSQELSRGELLARWLNLETVQEVKRDRTIYFAAFAQDQRALMFAPRDMLLAYMQDQNDGMLLRYGSEKLRNTDIEIAKIAVRLNARAITLIGDRIRAFVKKAVHGGNEDDYDEEVTGAEAASCIQQQIADSYSGLNPADYPGWIVLNVDLSTLFGDPEPDEESIQKLDNYYRFCAQWSTRLLVTWSCYPKWSAAGRINSSAKVIPALTSAPDCSTRVFFFDDDLDLDGGLATSEGICNLRDIRTGHFVDFAEGSNGFVREEKFSYTRIHHSAVYNNVLVKANILDAMADEAYFTDIIEAYSKPGEKILLFMDVNSSVLCGDSVAGKSTSYVVLRAMLEFMNVTPTSVMEFDWDGCRRVHLHKTVSIKDLVQILTQHRDGHRDKGLEAQMYQVATCEKLLTELMAEGNATLTWHNRSDKISLMDFRQKYEQYISTINKGMHGDRGIAKSWYNLWTWMQDGNSTVVINSYGLDSLAVVSKTVPVVRDVVQVTVNWDDWKECDRKSFQQRLPISERPDRGDMVERDDEEVEEEEDGASP